MQECQCASGVIRVGDEFYRTHSLTYAESVVFMRLRACAWRSHPQQLTKFVGFCVDGCRLIRGISYV